MGLLAAALGVKIGMPLSGGVLLSLAGVAATIITLRRYYASSLLIAAADRRRANQSLSRR